MEYLLANHPLDCPICDQGGECDLQDQSMVFGADRGRFYESKRSTPNKNLGFLIKTFLNRCIHCARCTRFLNELAGVPDIQLLGRGYKTEISNYVSSFVKSEISGNIIDLCPVGALTSKPYAYRARPWELFSVYSFDILDGFGSSIQLDFRGLELLRILPKSNKFLNEEWISDKTRFCYDAFATHRLTSPIMLVSGAYSIRSWLGCLRFYKNLVFYLSRPSKMPNISNIFGDFTDLETAASGPKLFSRLGLSYVGPEPLQSINPDFRKSFVLNNLGALDVTSTKLEDLNFHLFNLNLRYESPMLNLKIRRVFVDFSNNIFLSGFLSNLNYEFEHVSAKTGLGDANRFAAQLDALGFSSSLSRFFCSTETVFTNLSGLSRLEIGNLSGSGESNIQILFGQPEAPQSRPKALLSLCLNHHMEDDFLADMVSTVCVFLPTRFYFEKVASYINNSHNFFTTSYHFSYKLPNTKEEYRIIRALTEFVGRRDDKIHSPSVEVEDNTNLPAGEEEGFGPASDYFEGIPFFYTYIRLERRGSTVNDFYKTSVLSRLSSILNLCSSRLTVTNDYIYTSLN